MLDIICELDSWLVWLDLFVSLYLSNISIFDVILSDVIPSKLATFISEGLFMKYFTSQNTVSAVLGSSSEMDC